MSYSSVLGPAVAVFLVSNGAQADSPKPNYGAMAQQFHRNFSAGKPEKNGLLVDDSLTGTVNGESGFSYKGRAQFVEWLVGAKTAFPDMTITDQDVLVVGRTVAIRYRFQGTHTGPLQTPDGVLKATGKKVSSTGAEFFTFNATGKLIHLDTIEDDLSVFAQLKK